MCGSRDRFFCPFEQNKNNLNWPMVPPRRSFSSAGLWRIDSPLCEFSPATAVSSASPFLAVVLGLAPAEAGCRWIRELEAGLLHLRAV